MRTSWRMPELAVPFAPVGFAAGWLSAGFLINPLVALTLPGKQALSGVCAALVAAVVGAWLTRRCAPAPEWIEEGQPISRSATYVRLVAGVLAGGAVAGVLIGAISAPSIERVAYGVITGTVDGLVASLAFLPVCALVVSSAQSSARARFGSLVAAVDRRAIWSILATAIALTTLLATIDWPASYDGAVPPPYPALVAVIASVVGILWALVADLATLLRVRRAARAAERMEQREPLDDSSADHEVGVDLGMGHDVRKEIARGAAYRGIDRTIAQVLGDPVLALRAVTRSIKRGMWSLAIAGAVLAMHGYAMSVRAVVAYNEFRCSLGLTYSCHLGATILQQNAESGEDHRRVLDLYEQACNQGRLTSCRALANAVDADDLARSPWYLGLVCKIGDARSCARQAQAFLDEQRSPENLRVARDLFSMACDLGDAPSCPKRTLLRALAEQPPATQTEECRRLRQRLRAGMCRGCFACRRTWVCAVELTRGGAP